VKETFAVMGGVAKNVGVVKRLEQELGIKAVVAEPDPQITAAQGAALFAYDFLQDTHVPG
jgi:benzoyl-CoA reductase subunit A